jgi:hypothetical protein
MMNRLTFAPSRIAAIAGVTLLSFAGSAAALQVRVTIENLAPTQGTLLTPAWVGFHDGSFDLYNLGEDTSASLERLAEDGNTAPLTAAFGGSAGTGAQGTIGAPLLPGGVSSMVFDIDPNSGNSKFFSYASMVIPSNDAFIANGDATAFELFDSNGNFQGANFFVTGANVRDAGTEVNDESTTNTAALGQAAPDTGTTEGGVVTVHPGFLPAGSGGILDAEMFANADFKLDGFPIAQIQVSAVPLPPAVFLLGGALGALGFLRRRANK